MPLREVKEFGEPPPSENPLKNNQVSKLAQKIILDEYGPPSVLIYKDNQALYFSGNTEPFLSHPYGEASFDILKIARGNLSLRLGRLINASKDQQTTIREEHVKLHHNNKEIAFDIIIRPLKPTRDNYDYFLILFKEKSKQKAPQPKSLSSEDPRVKDLEEELDSARNELNTTIEELQISKEDLQSTNEALQAKNEKLQNTNEELETSKEEIKSTNEELNTVNQELKTKIEELSTTKNHINNLLSNTNIATLFLNKDLKIKFFTPKIKDIFNLLNTDINRSIKDINLQFFSDVDFMKDFQYVLDTLEKIDTEKWHQNGEWYNINMTPYRTTKNIIDGVVITFYNVTKIKSLERLATVVKDSNDAVMVLDLEGNILAWNKGAELIYGYSEEEALQMHIFKLLPNEKVEETRDLFQKIREGQVVTPFKTKRITKQGYSVDILLKITKLTDPSGNEMEMATTEKDLSEQKDGEKQYLDETASLKQQLKKSEKNNKK